MAVDSRFPMCAKPVQLSLSSEQARALFTLLEDEVVIPGWETTGSPLLELYKSLSCIFVPAEFVAAEH